MERRRRYYYEETYQEKSRDRGDNRRYGEPPCCYGHAPRAEVIATASQPSYAQLVTYIQQEKAAEKAPAAKKKNNDWRKSRICKNGLSCDRHTRNACDYMHQEQPTLVSLRKELQDMKYMINKLTAEKEEKEAEAKKEEIEAKKAEEEADD